MARAVAQAAQERETLEERFFGALAASRPDIKRGALRRIAREVVKRYRAFEENGIDVAAVLSEVADNLDSALTVEENVGLALDVLDKYARAGPAVSPAPDTQVEEARRRLLDLLWLKKEFGLNKEEEEELKALKEFLEKIGKLPSEAVEEENWREVLGPAAAPVPVKAPVELIEVEAETWLPEPGSVRLNSEELYRALAKKARELAVGGLL